MTYDTNQLHTAIRLLMLAREQKNQKAVSDLIGAALEDLEQVRYGCDNVIVLLNDAKASVARLETENRQHKTSYREACSVLENRSAQLVSLREAAVAAIAWDKARKFVMPYAVRDPLIKAVGEPK